jgi:hypothetical protein
MVNSGLLWFVAYLGLVMTLVVAMYRICLKTSRESKPLSAGLLHFGLYLLGSDRLHFRIVDRPLPMRAAASLTKATGE